MCSSDLKREVKLAAARMDQVQATASFNTGAVLGQVANPNVNFSRTSAVSSLNLEPRGLAPGSLTGTKAPENKIDMALEMLDVNSMDTGRYRAMIIQDPNDRQAVSGFVKMAQVMSGRSVAAGQTGWGSINVLDVDRSEERRVGKEGRSRVSAEPLKKKQTKSAVQT